MAHGPRDDRVRPLIRGVAYLIVPFPGLSARHQWSVHNVLTRLFAAGFIGTLVVLVAVYLRMEVRTRAGR